MRIRIIFFLGAITPLLLMFTAADVRAPTNVIMRTDEGGYYRLELTGGEDAATSTNMLPLAAYRFQDRVYLCSVMFSNFVRGPRWDSDSAEPPLSTKSALAIAQRHAWRLFPETRILEINAQEIALKQLRGVWFYIVYLEPLDELAYRYGARGKVGTIQIPVLLDGTVVEGVEEQQQSH